MTNVEIAQGLVARLVAAVEHEQIECPRCQAYDIEQSLMVEADSFGILFCPHCGATYTITIDSYVRGPKDVETLTKYLAGKS